MASDWASEARRQSIVLVNPVSGRGHLDAYARLYSRALSNLGYDIILIAESDDGIQQDTEPGVTFLSLPKSSHDGDQAGPRFDRSHPLRSATAKVRHLYQKGGATAVIEHSVFSFRRILGGRNGCIAFDRFVNVVIQALVERPPALVIFLYLDMMESNSSAVRQLEMLGHIPFIGILFHPTGVNSGRGIERFFSARNARGAIMLVPAATELYSRALPRLTFALAPDVADFQLPATQQHWIESLRARAGGRTIVLQAGTVSPHKGIKQLIEVIKIADVDQFFFAVVGEPDWNAFGADKRSIQSFFARPPENVFARFGYIECEADYNALLCACDIIYAVYLGFNSSSNSLTKAAGFQRRILVAEGTLMGRRVLEARIGDVAPQSSPQKIYDALRRLARRSTSDFEFGTYATQHSLESLKGVLDEALPRWLSPPRAKSELTFKHA